MADVKRKTANLFSDKLIGMTWWDGVIVVDERFTLHIAEVKPNTEYTASGNNSVDNIMVTYYSVYPAEGQSSVISSRYVYPTDPTRSVATFTTPDDSRIKYAAVRFGSDATDVMFNIGSTALPYEPYGWVHSLRKLGTSTDTITTLPADIYADGNIATVGLVGNMTQASGVSPDNPIQPQETGEMTGNLWDEDYTGINTNAIYRPLFVGDGVFTLSTDFKPNQGITDIFLLSGNVSSGISSSTNGAYEGKNITAQSVNGYITIAYRANARAGSGSLPYCKTMLNTGSTALPYEPYGIKIPISSASTTTPVYLGEVETTRKIKKLVLDGTENWAQVGSNYIHGIYISQPPIGNYEAQICSHFVHANSWSELQNTNLSFGISSLSRVVIHDESIQTTEGFKSYLAAQYAAGTPVTVWYVLATPETAVVNEPLRKIGEYADAVSGITIPTITGKDTFDVQTTLKPSEVSLAYTGWHDATVKEWDGLEWQ